MAQSENTQKVRRFPKPAEDETVAIPILEGLLAQHALRGSRDAGSRRA